MEYCPYMEKLLFSVQGKAIRLISSPAQQKIPPYDISVQLTPLSLQMLLSFVFGPSCSSILTIIPINREYKKVATYQALYSDDQEFDHLYTKHL